MDSCWCSKTGKNLVLIIIIIIISVADEHAWDLNWVGEILLLIFRILTLAWQQLTCSATWEHFGLRCLQKKPWSDVKVYIIDRAPSTSESVTLRTLRSLPHYCQSTAETPPQDSQRCTNSCRLVTWRSAVERTLIRGHGRTLPIHSCIQPEKFNPQFPLSANKIFL